MVARHAKRLKKCIGQQDFVILHSQIFSHRDTERQRLLRVSVALWPNRGLAGSGSQVVTAPLENQFQRKLDLPRRVSLAGHASEVDVADSGIGITEDRVVECVE